MKKKVGIFFFIALTCVIGTFIFLLYHHNTYSNYGVAEWLKVIRYCIPQHLTVAGYIMALPLVLEIGKIWQPAGTSTKWHDVFMRWYLTIMAVLLFIAWVSNMILYGFWGTVLDSTVLMYLGTPKEVMIATPVWAMIATAGGVGILVYALLKLLKHVYDKGHKKWAESTKTKSIKTAIVLVLFALNFLAIRGGVTTSTMNPGRAYFSSEMTLNHAAVDPLFNFLYSISKQKAFNKQYRFMKDEKAVAALAELNALRDDKSAALDSVSLLKNKRPNILLIILESFSGSVSHALNPEANPDWMPTINRMYAEGIGFTNFYANSFRTDRGVAAILSGYPGQPNNSVMKQQDKCENLQFISKRLGENGYKLQFIQGGDINFTNKKGYLRSGGVVDIVSEDSFPVSQRLDKWGVRDDLMFSYMYDNVKRASSSQDKQPFFKTFLTISSHEPFDVPFHHFDDLYINSVAYTDSCLGSLIDKLKAEPAIWDNLLIIGVADHCFGKFPADILQYETRRYRIPMFWAGGALKQNLDKQGKQLHTIDVLGQQTDLAATLLGQMGIGHEDFNFSKDLLDKNVPHYAFYTFNDGFGMLTEECQYVQDNTNNGVGLLSKDQDPDGKAELWGKAYLQKLYDDLNKR